MTTNCIRIITLETLSCFQMMFPNTYCTRYECVKWQSNTTTLHVFFNYLGQHVSTLIGPSSGPSKIQILKLTMFKMHCGIPNAYILDISMYKT